MALTDTDTGAPTLVPAAFHFGLPDDWTFDAVHSAIMTRRYSTFNTYRHRRNPERQVLRRGSVLTFSGDGPVQPENLARTLEQGVGLYREDGLGRIVVAPYFLDSVHPHFAHPPQDSTSEKSRANKHPPSPIGYWMERTAERAKWETVALKAAVAIKDQLVKKMSGMEKKPGRSQWNQASGYARAEMGKARPSWANLVETLNKELFESGVKARLWQENTAGGSPLHEGLRRVVEQAVMDSSVMDSMVGQAPNDGVKVTAFALACQLVARSIGPAQRSEDEI